MPTRAEGDTVAVRAGPDVVDGLAEQLVAALNGVDLQCDHRSPSAGHDAGPVARLGQPDQPVLAVEVREGEVEGAGTAGTGLVVEAEEERVEALVTPTASGEVQRVGHLGSVARSQLKRRPDGQRGFQVLAGERLPLAGGDAPVRTGVLQPYGWAWCPSLRRPSTAGRVGSSPGSRFGNSFMMMVLVVFALLQG